MNIQSIVLLVLVLGTALLGLRIAFRRGGGCRCGLGAGSACGASCPAKQGEPKRPAACPHCAQASGNRG